MIKDQFKALKSELLDITHLKAALGVLGWDMEVYMPKKGVEARAQTMAMLASLIHERFTALDKDGGLTALKKASDDQSLSDQESIVVKEVWREYEREVKLPEVFVKELAETTSRGSSIWALAREKSDFSHFLPTLSRIIELKQQEAELVGYNESSYDALLDTYEPHTTTTEVAETLKEVKQFLVPFISQIKEAGGDREFPTLLGKLNKEKQSAFNHEVARAIGYDLEAGRIDLSAHPFTTTFHMNDVRITTRFNAEDILYSLMPTLHEAGHAMYEQGIAKEHFGTPLGEAISLGIHESQSRMWEHMVGSGRPFWHYFYPKLVKLFPKPFASVTFDDFYRVLNRVQPSLVRVEADEVTYNLHIIIRFELEQELISGTLAAKDLPEAWNAKMMDYFGLEVPDDAHGVLQDVHWSHGYFGYFPTYTLGNLYAAQFYAAAKRELPDMEVQFAEGNFTPLREWLRHNIHIHGKAYRAQELVKHVTGQPLSARFFTDYLSHKYRSLYDF